MKFIISNSATSISSKNATSHNVTFNEFVQMLNKPELITADFSKYKSKIVIPASMIHAGIRYTRTEPKIEITKDSEGNNIERKFLSCYNEDELVAELWLNNDGSATALRKTKTNMVKVSMLAIDFDDITDKNELFRVHEVFNSMNLNHVLYQSISYGIEKEGSMKYNFRAFIPLAVEIPKHMWGYVASYLMIELEQKLYYDAKCTILELRDWKSKKELRKFIDNSTIQETRHQMFPYVRNGQDFVIVSKIDGKPIETYEACKNASKLLKEDKNNALAVAERRDNAKKKDVTTGGTIDLGRNVLGQISWSDFDLEHFIYSIGADLTFDNHDKWVGRCPNEASHKSASGSKDFHIRDTGEIPVVSCSHASCAYHGEGATTRLFTDYANRVDSNCVKHYKSNTKIEFVPLVEEFEQKIMEKKSYELEIEKTYGNIEDAFKLNNDYQLIIGKTGVGKSTIIAKKTAKIDGPVLILCSTIAECSQMYETLVKEGINIEDMHVLTSENSKIGNARIVITHYYYTLRRGHSTDLYNLVDWVDEHEPTLFCDEIDTYTQIAFNQIQLSTRYGKNIEKDLHIKIDTCRSFACNRMMCDNCHKQDRVWREYQSGQPIFKYYNNPRNYIFHDDRRTNLDQLSSVNNVTDEIVIKSTKLHTLSYKKLAWTVADLDNPFELDSNDHYYINDIIATSLYAFKISTNEDLKEYNLNIFRQLADKYKNAHQKDYSEDKMKTWVNNEMNKMHLYPYHTCGVETLCYLDTKGFSRIISRSKKRFFLTGTITPYQLKTLNSLCSGELKQYIVETPVDANGKPLFQPIKNLLVLTTTGDIDFSKHYKYVVDNIKVKTINGVKINKVFAVVDTKSTLDKLKTTSHEHMGFFDPDSKCVTVTENLRNGNWNILATHKRSSLTRGINLGEFSVIYYDYQANKSMNAYDFGETQDIEEARTLEHTTLTLQGTGRINRKPIINGELSDDAPNKVIIIYNAFENDSENNEIDVTDRLNEMMLKEYEGRCDTVNAIKLNRYFNEEDLVRISAHAFNKFINYGEVDIIRPMIPKEYFTKSWSDFKDSHIVHKLFTKEEFDEIKELAKYSEKLEEYIEKYTGLSLVERRRSCNWDRLKDKIPQKLLKSYLNFFEEEK